MKYLVPCLAATLLAAAPLAAQVPAKETVVAEADTAQNRIVCKTEKVSGTRLGTKKVCMTAAQWAQIHRDNRDTLERTQREKQTF